MTDRSAVAYRVMGARATLVGGGNSLANIITEALDNGSRCYVTADHAEWQLDKLSTASPDGSTIIAPIAGPGRWLRGTGGGAPGAYLIVPTISDRNAITGQEGLLVFVQSVKVIYQLAADLTTWDFFDASPELATQEAWEVNAVTGSDDNDGKPGTPLATSEELCRRLCPRGAELAPQQNTVVNFSAHAYGKLRLNIVWPDIASFSHGFTVRGTITQVITGNVTAVVNGVPQSTRPQVTVASGTLVAGQRMQYPPDALETFASGAAITFSNGLNANAQNSFTPVWSDVTDAHGTNISPGGPIGVDTLHTSFDDIDIQNWGLGYTDIINAQLSNCTRALSTFDASPASLDYGLQFLGCEISGSWFDVHADLVWCRNTADVVFAGGAPRFYACAIQNQITFMNQCYAQFRAAVNMDGGNVLVFNGCQLLQVDQFEMENGTSDKIAIAIKTGCFFSTVNACWGLAGAYGTGIRIDAGAGATYVQSSDLSIPSAINVDLGGNHLAFGGLPADFPGCFFVASP